MKRRNSGFSILELVIALAIVMLVLAAATTFFISSVRQYKTQTKIIETNIEGVLGLELLRQDLESLGFGLPWSNVSTTNEANSGILNDFANPPKAIVSLDNAFIPAGLTVNKSDYLVIKSTRVGMGSAAGKWTTLQVGGVARSWGSEEDLVPSDQVIVLSPTLLNNRRLVTPSTGAQFSTVKNSTTYAPADNLTVTNIVYGVDNTSSGLRFPFNRADYYIDNASLTVPKRCAPITGVLVKRVVSHVDGSLTTPPLPLLDCAADMQIIYGLDLNGDKAVEDWENDITTLTSDTIRTQLVEVRIHILAQEGQRDDSYAYPYDNVFVGSEGHGRSFIFTSYGFTSSGNVMNNFKHYRWKVYTIVVKPRNLGN